MGLREYVPYTQARRDRLEAEILHKEAAGKDGLAEIEWEDGSVTRKPVEWDQDNSAIVDEQGNRFFARGLGSDPKQKLGVDHWRIYAGNAGIIATEAALIADALRFEDRVYDLGAGDELPDDIIAEGLIDPNQQMSPADVWDAVQLDRETVEIARRIKRGEDVSDVLDESGPTADSPGEDGDSGGIRPLFSDGGVAASEPGTPGQHVEMETTESIPEPDDLPDGAAVFDLRPPEGYDGIAISIREPDYFDPWPVTRADAKGAVEWAQHAEKDSADTWMYGFIVGLLVFAGIWLLMTVVPWLLGQIGGGGGGGGGGENLPGLVWLFAAPASPLRQAIAELRDRVAQDHGGDA